MLHNSQAFLIKLQASDLEFYLKRHSDIFRNTLTEHLLTNAPEFFSNNLFWNTSERLLLLFTKKLPPELHLMPIPLMRGDDLQQKQLSSHVSGSATSSILVQVHPSTGPALLHLNSCGQRGNLADQIALTHVKSKAAENAPILLQYL